MSETRMITVKGDASIFNVNPETNPGAKRTRRRAKPISASSGGNAPVLVKMDATGQQMASPPATDVGLVATATAENATSSPAQAPTKLQGGASKVVLGNKKPKQTKVILTKKNHSHDNLTNTSDQTDSTTIKKHRKVTLGLQHLKRRVTKARRLNKITKSLSLEQIKKELVAAKIIKEDSKAPEAILRQMYADAKLITTKSL